MDEDEVPVVVVGNGLFGAAATRHLAEAGMQVLTIGAASSGPDRRAAVETDWPAHRVYSSHNDAARLTRLQDRDPRWAATTRRAVERYRTFEDASGVDFFHDVGCLIVARPGGDGLSPDPLAIMNETGVQYELYPPGDRSWRDTWPEIDFPSTHYVAFEGSPAGYLRPKQLIRAQNVVAAKAGARFLEDTVTGITPVGGRYRIETAGGNVINGDQVVVCAGAFANFNNLLSSAVNISLKSEVIVLGEVSASDADVLRGFPTVKFLVDVGDLEGIYMVPPVLYEDGRHYIKLGANTRLDQWFDGLDEVQRWFNADTDPDYLPLYEPVLRSLWPSLDFVSVATQPCVITYSQRKVPIIEHRGRGLYVATAGNGGGAKGSDAWGEQVAELVLQASIG